MQKNAPTTHALPHRGPNTPPQGLLWRLTPSKTEWCRAEPSNARRSRAKPSNADASFTEPRKVAQRRTIADNSKQRAANPRQSEQAHAPHHEIRIKERKNSRKTHPCDAMCDHFRFNSGRPLAHRQRIFASYLTETKVFVHLAMKV